MKRETGGLQEPLLTIAVACIIDVALRPAALPATEKSGKEGRTGNGLAAGLGLGGALFLTHWLFADTAVLSRFMGAGYPEPGPAPFPHGLSVLGALALGLVLSTVRRLVASPVWWGVAAVGGTALVYAEGYPAYAGGLVLGTYIMSVFPRLISAVAQHNPGYSVTVALLVYNVLLFADVWYVGFGTARVRRGMASPRPSHVPAGTPAHWERRGPAGPSRTRLCRTASCSASTPTTSCLPRSPRSLPAASPAAARPSLSSCPPRRARSARPTAGATKRSRRCTPASSPRTPSASARACSRRWPCWRSWPPRRRPRASSPSRSPRCSVRPTTRCVPHTVSTGTRGDCGLTAPGACAHQKRWPCCS